MSFRLFCCGILLAFLGCSGTGNKSSGSDDGSDGGSDVPSTIPDGYSSGDGAGTDGTDGTDSADGTDGADNVGLADAGDSDGGDPVKRYVYTDKTEPTSDLPDDSATWDSLTPPIAQNGGDNGDDALIYSAALGGYYFLRVQLEDGSYNYEYNPDKDEWIWKDVIHRQVGPAYAQVLLYQALQREEFRLSAEWAFDYAKPRLKEQKDGSLLISDIGATSLFIMGLTHYTIATENKQWEETFLKLGKYLLAHQKEDGNFTQGSALGQGQVIQALGHIYKATKDEKWLDAMEKGLKHKWDNIGDIELGTLPYFAVYVNEVLADLYAVRPAQWIVDFAYYNADNNVSDQYTADDTDKPHWVGGFYKTDKSTPSWSACLRLEGIADAYRLAVMIGDTEKAALYKERLLIGAKFQQMMQWRKPETDDFAQPELIIGAYPYYGHKNLTRTDFSWHSSAMLLKVTKYLNLEDFPGNPASVSAPVSQ